MIYLKVVLMGVAGVMISVQLAASESQVGCSKDLFGILF